MKEQELQRIVPHVEIDMSGAETTASFAGREGFFASNKPNSSAKETSRLLNDNNDQCNLCETLYNLCKYTCYAVGACILPCVVITLVLAAIIGFVFYVDFLMNNDASVDPAITPLF